MEYSISTIFIWSSEDLTRSKPRNLDAKASKAHIYTKSGSGEVEVFHKKSLFHTINVASFIQEAFP